MLVSFPHNGQAVAGGAEGRKEPLAHSLSAALGGSDFACPNGVWSKEYQPLTCRSGALQPHRCSTV